jgi:hypothetical protein
MLNLYINDMNLKLSEEFFKFFCYKLLYDLMIALKNCRYFNIFTL